MVVREFEFCIVGMRRPQIHIKRHRVHAEGVEFVQQIGQHVSLERSARLVGITPIVVVVQQHQSRSLRIELRLIPSHHHLSVVDRIANLRKPGRIVHHMPKQTSGSEQQRKAQPVPPPLAGHWVK